MVELCIKSTGDIRNDREDNSSRAFQKAAYRQFILARYGRLGKGNRRVCPSCVVMKIRKQYGHPLLEFTWGIENITANTQTNSKLCICKHMFS